MNMNCVEKIVNQLVSFVEDCLTVFQRLPLLPLGCEYRRKLRKNKGQSYFSIIMVI